MWGIVRPSQGWHSLPGAIPAATGTGQRPVPWRRRRKRGGPTIDGHEESLPPRHPLRVRFETVQLILRPGDPDYEDEFQRAVRPHDQGLPMPYASADLVTVAEAARRVGLAASVLHHWVTCGRLAAQPGYRRRLVSLAAVHALIAARHRPRLPGQPRELPGDTADYVPPSVAARLVGRRPSTVTGWAHKGIVASKPSPHGRLVRFADVEARAATEAWGGVPQPDCRRAGTRGPRRLCGPRSPAGARGV
jgi:hypothetical protein